MRAPNGLTTDDRWSDMVPQRPHSALFRGGAGTMMWRKPPAAQDATHRHDSMSMILAEAQNQERHAGRLLSRVQGFVKNAGHSARTQQTQLQELLQKNVTAGEVQARSLSHNRQFPERELKHHSQEMKELHAKAKGASQGPLTSRAHHNQVTMVDVRIKQAQDAIENGEKLITCLGTMMDADRQCVALQQG